MRGPIPSWLRSWGIVLLVSACGGGEERLSAVDVPGHGGAGGVDGQGSAVTPTGTVIVGVTSYHGVQEYKDLRVIMRVDGAVVDEQTYIQGAEPPIAFPMEIVFSDRPAGAEVEVELRGRSPGGALFERLAKTTVLARETLLLRVHLTEDCTWSYSDTEVTRCEAPLTCSWGQCRDPYAPSSGLETYSPAWASYSYCKPPMAGEPVLSLGTGALEYQSVEPFDVLTAVAGGQGGHHIWVSLRMKNLQQNSSVTLAGHFPDLDLDIGPFSYYIGFAENLALGTCERTGLGFQIDYSVDISELLGMGMQVSAKIEDADGATAEDTRTIAIANTIEAH